MAYELDVEPALYINLDLFPATVRSESGNFEPKHEEYRVIVTDNYVYVVEEGGNAPIAVVREPLTGFAKTDKTEYTVTTDSEIYHIERAANCGCGSRLRGFHPFSGVPYISQLPK